MLTCNDFFFSLSPYFLPPPPQHGAAVLKRQGKVAELDKAIAESGLALGRVLTHHVGIAHTRWATHGVPNEVNCHPHLSDPTGEFTVVHNGIITNYKDLRRFLESKGYAFASETDTECVAILIKYLYDTQTAAGEAVDLRTLVEDCASQLEGAYALVFKSARFPGEIVATRLGSPLLVGIRRFAPDGTPDTGDMAGGASSDIAVHINAPGPATKGAGPARAVQAAAAGGAAIALSRSTSWTHVDGAAQPVEYFFASDASAVIEHTKRVMFLEDHDVAWVKDGALSIHRHHRHSAGGAATRTVQTLEVELQEIMKGKFPHFMLKEIFEQPESVVNTMRGRVDFAKGRVVLGGMTSHLDDMRRARRLLFIACGTSYNSAMATRQFLEETTELPVIVDIASDFLDRQCPIFRDDVCFFISQSGETADTLQALRYCKAKGALVVGVTNTVGSSISRETVCGVHLNAGPEIGVASTKAYTSQIIALVLLGLTLASDRVSMQGRVQDVVAALHDLPEKIRTVLAADATVKSLAEQMYQEKSLLVMGRGVNFGI
jgi:glucosamine--fructose-6-phosphate aminotransferase (isomerizing)